jgi:hypothetical protein
MDEKHEKQDRSSQFHSNDLHWILHRIGARMNDEASRLSEYCVVDVDVAEFGSDHDANLADDFPQDHALKQQYC